MVNQPLNTCLNINTKKYKIRNILKKVNKMFIQNYYPKIRIINEN